MISKLYGTGALDRIIDIKRWRKVAELSETQIAQFSRIWTGVAHQILH